MIKDFYCNSCKTTVENRWNEVSVGVYEPWCLQCEGSDVVINYEDDINESPRGDDNNEIGED